MVTSMVLDGEDFLYDAETMIGGRITDLTSHVSKHPEIGCKTPDEYFQKGIGIIKNGVPYDFGFVDPVTGTYVGIGPIAVPDPSNPRLSLRVIKTIHKKREFN